jgi:hypothetical protein
MDFLELQERMRALTRELLDEDFPLSAPHLVYLLLSNDEFRCLYNEWRAYQSDC